MRLVCRVHSKFIASQLVNLFMAGMKARSVVDPDLRSLDQLNGIKITPSFDTPKIRDTERRTKMKKQKG